MTRSAKDVQFESFKVSATQRKIIDFHRGTVLNVYDVTDRPSRVRRVVFDEAGQVIECSNVNRKSDSMKPGMIRVLCEEVVYENNLTVTPRDYEKWARCPVPRRNLLPLPEQDGYSGKRLSPMSVDPTSDQNIAPSLSDIDEEFMDRMKSSSSSGERSGLPEIVSNPNATKRQSNVMNATSSSGNLSQGLESESRTALRPSRECLSPVKVSLCVPVRDQNPMPPLNANPARKVSQSRLKYSGELSETDNMKQKENGQLCNVNVHSDILLTDSYQSVQGMLQQLTYEVFAETSPTQSFSEKQKKEQRFSMQNVRPRRKQTLPVHSTSLRNPGTLPTVNCSKMVGYLGGGNVHATPKYEGLSAPDSNCLPLKQDDKNAHY